jgi:hypothetical protein
VRILVQKARLQDVLYTQRLWQSRLHSSMWTER